MVRGTGRRADSVVHERGAGRVRRRSAGHGLRQRVAAAAGRARRLRKLLAPDQLERTERPTHRSRRFDSAPRTQIAHCQRQPPAHQPGGLREHAPRRVRRVYPTVRQGRFRPQRPRQVPVLLRDRHTRAGRRPVRPGPHVQGVSGGVRGAGSHARHILPDAHPLPADGRSGRRR